MTSDDVAGVAGKGEQVVETAEDWAAAHFGFTHSERVANHSWAKTYRLSGREDGVAFLKVVRQADQGGPASIKYVSDSFRPHVPALIAQDAGKGYFLFADHGGTQFERKLTPDLRTEALALYGDIQRKAKPTVGAPLPLPSVSCVDQLDGLLALLEKATTDDKGQRDSGNPFGYMRSRTVEKYRSVFHAAAPILRRHLARGDRLEPTLNHCDLRARNIAQRPDGTLCIFDWDDAVFGPPGLSLHAQFSGCTRVHLALSGHPVEEGDQDALDGYIKVLKADDAYTEDQLRDCLAATACAGVMRYITGFAAYPTTNARSREAIARNVRKRMSDLLDVACGLAVAAPEDVGPFIAALEGNGRGERAEKVRRAAAERQLPQDQYQRILEASDPPDVFPTVEISDEEVRAGTLSERRLRLAVEMFRRHGGLMLRNAFSTDLVNRCQDAFAEKSEAHQSTIKQGAARRVGNQRFMISLELAGVFAEPDLVASPFVLPVLHRLLTRDAILGSFTAVASMPGARDQSLHRDNPPLFEEQSGMETPSFCIALIIPLIPLDEQTGATRIIKGSHKLRTREIDGLPFQNPTVDLGSCYLMDSRLFHQGMANTSDKVRPILSLVYQRPWYRDHKNFKKQSPLIMSSEQISQFPEPMQKLVQWAGDPA